MSYKPLEEEFMKLSTKFLFLSSDSSVPTEELNLLLNSLNCLDYKNQEIIDFKAILRLIESFQSIKTNEDTLIVKICCLIKILISKQKLDVPENVSIILVEWILKCLDNCFYSILCESLDVLSILFKNDSGVSLKYSEKLLSSEGFLIKLLENHNYKDSKPENFDKNSPEEIHSSVLSCIESILCHLSSTGTTFEIAEDILEVSGKTIAQFLYNLQKDDLKEIHFYNIVTSSLNSLRFVCQNHSGFVADNVGELIGISKAFMMYGLPDFTYQQPQKILSSQQAVLEPQPLTPNKLSGRPIKTRKLKTSQKNKKPEKKKIKETPSEDTFKQPYSANSITFDELVAISNQAYRTSDSDFSDNEKSKTFVNRHKQSKMRQVSLSLMAAVAQSTEKRIAFGFWHALFPTEETTSTTASLMNSILRDTSPRCKIIALQAIALLLHGSKAFLIQADTRDKSPASFTPFSVALGNMITSMYEKLTQALVKEGDLTVLAQILKCLTVFIQATPFHRLKTGIVGNFVKYVRLLVRHRNPTIKVAALMVMGHLISISDITTEIYELVEIPKSNIQFDRKTIDESIRSVAIDDEELIELDLDEEYEEEVTDQETKEPSKKVEMPWLLQIVLENLGVTSTGNQIQASPATSVRTESLQVLSAMTSHYLLVKSNLEFIGKALINSFRDPVNDVRLYASRVLDLMGHSINTYLSSQENLNHEDLESSLNFWLAVLPLVIEQIQDINQSPSLRACFCDALGNIGVLAFEKLPHDKHILLISVLSGCGCDDEAILRSSAIRTLAVYSVFPSLREDLGFLENTTEAILRIINENNVLIKIKASWALGNIVDALLITKNNNEIGKINDNLLRQMMEVNLECSQHNDKIKVNAVRTIGNILKLLTRGNMENPLWVQLFERSVKSLNQNLLNCGNVKVKWNCCYAFGSLMKNSLFFEEKFRNKWQMVVFPSLCEIIRTSSNFKVRIHATCSVTSPKNRTEFGVYFMNIWCTLLMALEQSNHLMDFNEYKHRDSLQEQLCTSLSHLINLMQPEDSIAMKNELFPLIDITKQNWNRVLNRLLPEKSLTILTACAKLNEMEKNSKVSEQRNAINIINSCFKPIEQAF